LRGGVELIVLIFGPEVLVQKVGHCRNWYWPGYHADYGRAGDKLGWRLGYESVSMQCQPESA
jgi:hypothetical protein